MTTQATEKKQWPKEYALRSDGALLLPVELLLILGWEKGDKMQITVGPNMIEVRKAAQ